MGVAVFRFLLFSLFTFISTTLWAAPQLRLNTATVGPLSIPEKTSGPAQLVEAYNIGDGLLSLSATVSVPWLAPGVGRQLRPCQSRAGSCVPVEIRLQTSSLAKGIHTGVVTLDDSNAVDAPQTITVTVQIGGAVPDKLELFAPPGGIAKATFTTTSELRGQSTQPWLELALDASGSFRFDYPYRIQANSAGMAEGTYTGALSITHSMFAIDRKTVDVSLRVTSQPIAQVTPERVRIRLAQGSPKQTRWLSLANAGRGDLALTTATAAMASEADAKWLVVDKTAGLLASLIFEPGQLPAGTYQGSVALATNAANASIAVPVELEVVAQANPLTLFGGVVNNATFLPGPVAQGDLAALFGEQLLFKDPVKAEKLPLADAMGGVRVFVNNRPVPLYYVSYSQINFQIPYDTPPGQALVRVEREGRPGNSVSAEVAERAPRLLRLGIGNYGIIVNQDYTFPIPVTPGVASHPARAGNVLTIYALGLGPTDPPAADGAGAPGVEPLARVSAPVKVHFSGGFQGYATKSDPLYAGLAPTFVGLYQVNAMIPEGTMRGPEIPVYLDVGGVVSNRVNIAME
jgi:uncharacterized protein (TIGR03437 family)